MQVRHSEPEDRAAVAAFLAANHSARVARLGELEEPLAHRQLIAVDDGQLAGVLTYPSRCATRSSSRPTSNVTPQ